MTASQRIRYLIKTENLTIEAFAKEANITRSTLQQMFKKDSNPKLPLLQACLRIFPKVNPRWLLVGENPIWETETSSNKSLDYQVLKKRVKELEGLLNEQVKKMEQQVEKDLTELQNRIAKLERKEK